MTAEPALSVLFVCTGNICRSALAERVLRAALRRTDIAVASAGTQGGPDLRVTPEIIELAAVNGATMDGFVSRLLMPELVQRADLVLTATTAHRATVLRDEPGALRRTFTLLEFVAADDGRPTEPGPPSRAEPALPSRAEPALPSRTELLEQIRSRSERRPPPGAWDILDPYLGGAARYAEMGSILVPAVRSVSHWLRGFPEAASRV